MNFQSFSQIAFAFSGHAETAGVGAHLLAVMGLVGGMLPANPRRPSPVS
jgi:hypothetical protein